MKGLGCLSSKTCSQQHAFWLYFHYLEGFFFFLLQVPKYLSLQWQKATGRGEVGKVQITRYVTQK